METTPNKINPKISNEELNMLPLRSFNGKIVLVTRPDQVSCAFKEIVDHEAVGFDTETRPVFVKGQRNDISLIQVAIPDKVFLFRLRHTGFREEITSFLENEGIRKAGVALRDDIKGLQRLTPFVPGGFVELAEMAFKAGIEEEGVKKLTGLLLGFRISKSAQTSNWDATVLNQSQLLYAATDAWVCLKIHERLRSLCT